MASHTTIVIGASRGIGQELATYIAQKPNSHVIATMRRPLSLDQSNIDVIPDGLTYHCLEGLAAGLWMKADKTCVLLATLV